MVTRQSDIFDLLQVVLHHLPKSSNLDPEGRHWTSLINMNSNGTVVQVYYVYIYLYSTRLHR